MHSRASLGIVVRDHRTEEGRVADRRVDTNKREAAEEDDKRAGDQRFVGGFRSVHRQWLPLRRRYAPSGIQPGDGGRQSTVAVAQHVMNCGRSDRRLSGCDADLIETFHGVADCVETLNRGLLMGIGQHAPRFAELCSEQRGKPRPRRRAERGVKRVEL